MTNQKITLATLSEATAQQVFDQVALHLLTQNEKSLVSNFEKCVYRGDRGLMCAAGCLIGDDEYQPYFDDSENNLWGSLVQSGYFPPQHTGLIQELQSIHDMNHPFDWQQQLQSAAKSFGLSDDVVTSFQRNS